DDEEREKEKEPVGENEVLQVNGQCPWGAHCTLRSPRDRLIRVGVLMSAPLTSPTTAPSRRTSTRSLRLTISSISEVTRSVEVPCDDSSLMRLLISSFAPTSTPRVGSSRMRIFAFRFCHLSKPTCC